MFANNLCGELGTITLASGESLPENTACFAGVVESDTVFSVLEQPGETGSAPAKVALLAKTYEKGEVIYGITTAATVQTGLVKFFKWHNLGAN
jgi:hypothetical protein